MATPPCTRSVERLYERVLADPDLAPYFHRTSIPVQRDKLAGMVTESLVDRVRPG